ncbi:hypothetical protein B0T20DRAFT_455903 [Sordaria brevicollis]|uniref:Uncharacterized protein n=1 Tax=Sordaria brevicollis TaxID=83679 RepID=A0AAE0U6N5_SORBR|nr:hypothetical protein B0T20DRAFT_455903 [Sordaria brevicollis]
MQCHEAHQAPNQHRREEGRRTINLPGTCQFGALMPRMQSPGVLLVVQRGSWIPQWLGMADGFRAGSAGHVVAGHGEIDGQEWTKLSGLVGLGCPDMAIGRLVMMLSSRNVAVSYQCPPP